MMLRRTRARNRLGYAPRRDEHRRENWQMANELSKHSVKVDRSLRLTRQRGDHHVVVKEPPQGGLRLRACVGDGWKAR